MDAIWTFIQNQFEHNQLFSGGLILMAADATAHFGVGRGFASR